MSDDNDIYDAVANYCADLVAETRNEDLVRNILRRESGEWTDILHAAAQLDVDMHDLSGLDGRLYATWLDGPTDTGMVVILFCMPDEVWSTIAMYNSSRIFG